MTGECECGKIRYYTRKEARQQARKILGSGRPGHLRAYRCDSGSFWHLTSESTAKVTRYRAYRRAS